MGANKNRGRARELVEEMGRCGVDAYACCGIAGLTPRMLGDVGEELASQYLRDRGYEVVERNYRCPDGEADIIAFDPDEEEVVLVEVKTRRCSSVDEDVFPEEAVSPAKRRRYRRIAYCYAMEHFPTCALRFDVIAVTFRPSTIVDLQHLYSAFDWEASV